MAEKIKRHSRNNRTIRDAARELGHALAEECPTPEVVRLSGASMNMPGEALEYVRAALHSLPADLAVSYKVSSLVEEVRQFRKEQLLEAEKLPATDLLASGNDFSDSSGPATDSPDKLSSAAGSSS